MNSDIELLAPGGGVDAIKAAIIAGADAVYCGLDVFNARNRASNISFDDLVGVIKLAHEYGCKIFLTLNIVMLEREFKSLTTLLSKLVNTTLDGVILQDIGLFNLITTHFPRLEIHASTQLTTHNAGQIGFLKALGASRVNLSREMNLREISAITKVADEQDVKVEVFVHGSLCIAFSGLCYSTSASVGNSGNRGRCSQACREEYETTESGNSFPLNIKDNSAFFDLPALIKAGVHSFKVEGRIKGANYVYTVIDSFRKQIDGIIETGENTEDGERLYQVFNRDFSNAFLRGDLNQSMFIDNPRDNSTKHAVDKSNAISVVQIHEVEQTLHQQNKEIKATVFDKINCLSIDKTPLSIVVSGHTHQPLTIKATTDKESFEVQSNSLLIPTDKNSIDESVIEKRFRSFNNSQYNLTELSTDALQTNLSIPFKEVSILKKQLANLLNNNQAVLPEVVLPKLVSSPKGKEAIVEGPKLSVLICDIADAYLSEKTDADIYFKLPDAYKRGCTKYVDLLKAHPNLIPWFPSVLIGKDYDVALNILQEVKPALVVTNNTGIAFEAYKLGIKWIAGPFLNTTNSYVLKAFKETFDCAGAFISNEINKQQIKNIARPENFKILYSIYHPILLMASRQCFFQQSVGCEKPRIDNGCMLSCDKSTTITNLKGEDFAIDKQKAGYPSIYNKDQFLNTEIIDDLSDLFDGFMIDLTNIGSGDKAMPDKTLLVQQFEQLLKEQQDKKVCNSDEVSQVIHNLVPESTISQYYQGL